MASGVLEFIWSRFSFYLKKSVMQENFVLVVSVCSKETCLLKVYEILLLITIIFILTINSWFGWDSSTKQAAGFTS